jgi:hypothetical protein
LGGKGRGGAGRKCRAISGFIKYKYPTILAHFTTAGPGTLVIDGDIIPTYCRTEVDAIKGTVQYHETIFFSSSSIKQLKLIPGVMFR